MMKFDKKTYMPIIVLISICVVVAALLAGVNMLTTERIKNAAAEKENQSLAIVMPDGKFNAESDTLRDDAPDTVKAVYTEKNGKGFVVLLTTNKGYTGKNISLTVAIDTEGKIINAVITENEESIVPPELKPNGSYGEKYKGLNAEEASALVTGATVKFTEKAIKDAINDAFKYLGYTDGAAPETPEEPEAPSIPEEAKSEAEILTLAADLVEGSAGFTKVDLDGNYENLIYVFRENSGKGYVAYTLVISANYGTVETETLVHIGTDAKIKNVKKIVWKTSDAMYGYVPPTAELVDAFYSKLNGSDIASLDTMVTNKELVSNATSTSTNLVNSIKEALTVVDNILKDEQILTLAKDLIGGTADFEDVTPKSKEYIRKLYKNKADGAYVAHIVVISANYGTVETETLVHIGTDAKIKGVKKIVWKTSDAIYGYVPPTAELVDAFYAKLPGSNIASLDAMVTNKELVSNATSTSTNLVNSIKEALTAAEELIKKDLPTPEEEILNLAATLVGGPSDFESISFDNSEYLKKLYKNNVDGSYVAYVVVISKNYGTVETETLIHISTDARIRNVKKIVWKTSDAMYGYEPPTAELVDAFYAKLPGNSSASLDTMVTNKELVSNATSTSTNLVNSIKEALTAAETLIRKETPILETEVINEVVKLIGYLPALEKINIYTGDYKYLKSLYKNQDDGSYVAHVKVISQYGSVETETLVHIGNDGIIKGVKRLIWKTSDAMYGYVPPTLEDADVIYSDMIGKEYRTVDGVTLVSNATNTSLNLVESVKEALLVIEDMDRSNAPRVIGIIAIILLVGSWTSVYVILRKRRGPYEK